MPAPTRLISNDITIWQRVAPTWVLSDARYHDHLDAIAMRGPRNAFAGLSDETVV